jgi:hypothetical protein
MNSLGEKNLETEEVEEIDHIGSYGHPNGNNIMLGLNDG